MGVGSWRCRADGSGRIFCSSENEFHVTDSDAVTLSQFHRRRHGLSGKVNCLPHRRRIEVELAAVGIKTNERRALRCGRRRLSGERYLRVGLVDGVFSREPRRLCEVDRIGLVVVQETMRQRAGALPGIPASQTVVSIP